MSLTRFSYEPFDLIVSEDLYLASCTYLNEEEWHAGSDDSFQDQRGVKWAIQVLKTDVVRLWPFGRSKAAEADNVASMHSGAPGRPTSMRLVEIEHSARGIEGKHLDSITAEAEALAQWLSDKHPSASRLKPKTICNNLRGEYRRRKNARK